MLLVLRSSVVIENSSYLVVKLTEKFKFWTKFYNKTLVEFWFNFVIFYISYSFIWCFLITKMNSLFELEFPTADKISVETNELANRSPRAIKTHLLNLLQFWALVSPELVSLSEVQNSTVALLGGLSRFFAVVAVGFYALQARTKRKRRRIDLCADEWGRKRMSWTESI